MKTNMNTQARRGPSPGPGKASRVGAAALQALLLTAALAPAGVAQSLQNRKLERRFYRPTAAGYGRPLTRVEIKDPVDVGILRCERAPGGSILSNCVVKNMPLLHQTDPRLDADVKDLGESGCYNASILTVALTALANRSAKLPAPAGRTKELLGVKADPANSVPKDVEQLSWLYRQAKRAEAGAKDASGKPAQPYYITETLADFGKIKEGCDPFLFADCKSATSQFGHTFYQFVENRTWTNQDVVKLMREGYALFIAFERYDPAVVVNAKGAPPRVRFGFVNMHKVVVSGFQAHKYPLLINDVGTGKQYRARLSSDPSARRFSLKGSEAKASQFPLNSFDPPAGLTFFLEYEGDGAGVNEQVQFVRHIDAIRLQH